jgi:type IV secretory pathway TraG/TraD family ATPase VirD4
MKTRTLLIVYLALMLAGLTGATQWVGHRLGYHPALQPGIRVGSIILYPPWAIVRWAGRFGPRIPRALAEGYAVFAAALIVATLVVVLIRRIGRRLPVRQIGPDRWARHRQLSRAGRSRRRSIWWRSSSGSAQPRGGRFLRS